MGAAGVAEDKGHKDQSKEQGQGHGQGQGLQILQQKVNASAEKLGIPAPDVRKELMGGKEEKEQEAKKVRGQGTNPSPSLSPSPSNPLTLSSLPKIDRIVAIPANTVRAIEGRDGRVLYLVDNGRFALVGTMVDIWNRKKLSSLDEIEDAVNHIDLTRMGFDVEKTNHIKIGNVGKRDSNESPVTIFVDPRCGWCHRLLKEIQSSPDLLEKYAFNIVVVSVLGDESKALAKRLVCAKESKEGKENKEGIDSRKKFQALVEGRSGLMDENLLPQISKSECEARAKKVLRNTELQQHALDINSVPFVISSDKRFVRGKPQDLRAFLDENEAMKAMERSREAQRAALRKAEKELAKSE